MLDKFMKKYISRLSLLVILFVFVITLLNTAISSLISAYIIREETGKYNLLILSRLSTLIDNEINNIDRNLLRFCQKNLAADNITSDLSGYYERYLLSKKIDSLAEETGYINSVYIYFDSGSKVYYHSVVSSMKSDGTKDTGGFFDKDLYAAFVAGSGLSHITGSRLLEPDYAPDPAMNGSWVVSFVKRIWINDTMSRNVIVINVNASHFLDMIRMTNMPKGSSVIVTDSAGETLFAYSETGDRMMQPGEVKAEKLISTGKPTEGKSNSYRARIFDENSYVTEMSSGSDKKNYILAIPEKELLKSVALFNTSMIVVASVILALGFIFAHAVDSKFFQPIIGILSKLKNRDTDAARQTEPGARAPGRRTIGAAAPELMQIDNYIDDMISRNLKQEAQLRSYFSCYKEKMLLSLLSGDSETIRLIHEEKIIFSSELKSFCVIVAAHGKSGKAIDVRIFESYVATINLQVQNSLLYFGKVETIKSGNGITFLLNMENGVESGSIKERLAAEVLHGIDPCVLYTAGIGGASSNLQGICSSYLEALMIVGQMEQINQTGFYDIADIKGENKCSYPRELGDRLVRLVGSGQRDDAIGSIRQFFFEMKKNAAHIDDVKDYAFRIVFNIARRMDKTRQAGDEPLLAETSYGELHGRNTLMDVEEWLISVLSRTFAEPEKESDGNNREMIEKVIKYIHAHYMEDIGLNTIAYHIYLSPSYLSKLFREESGFTFTEYLIKVRMEAAAKLLLDKNANISSIVGKVGYFSVQSFCRLFKSYFRCSPSEYRRRYAASELSGGDFDIS